MHCGYVVEVKELRPHSNADKLQLATFFGETVIVGLDTKIGDIGIYFPCDIQLSEKYCDANDLCRKRADGSDGNGYLERDKRNIKAIKLRGEKSFGFYAPLESLAFCFETPNHPDVGVMNFTVGDTITVVNGHEICTKYIPRSNRSNRSAEGGNRTRKKKAPTAPLFMEHADTEQLAYNLNAFKSGDEIEITLKMHGTSQRTGYLPTLKGYKRTLWDRICRREGTPIYDWGYVSGTRRTILENYDGGYYGSNEFREEHSKTFEGKLWKGETVYYEVVGFTHTGTPIMASCNNKKLNDKEFIKQYGEETVFSYGCAPRPVYEVKAYTDGSTEQTLLKPQSDIYVYRITMTNEDGDVVDYTPDFMRYRCEQMGVKTVPVMWKGIIPREDILNGPHLKENETMTAGEWILPVAEQYYDGPDPIGKTHIREGVVVRILNRPKFCAYKHKNHSFKMISGIITESVADSNIEISEDILSEL